MTESEKAHYLNLPPTHRAEVLAAAFPFQAEVESRLAYRRDPKQWNFGNRRKTRRNLDGTTDEYIQHGRIAPPANQWCYFIRTGSGHLKIGVSSNPNRRLRQFQTCDPHAELINYTFGGDAVEAWLHLTLKAFLVPKSREVFNYTRDVERETTLICSTVFVIEDAPNDQNHEVYRTLSEKCAMLAVPPTTMAEALYGRAKDLLK